MVLNNFLTAIAKDIPVLFAYIGWSERYVGDPSDPIVGNHRELAVDSPHIMEVNAFLRGKDGYSDAAWGLVILS